MWQHKKVYETVGHWLSTESVLSQIWRDRDETVGHNISTESNMKRSREQYYIYKYQSKDNYDHYIMLHLHRGRGQDP